jgi:hypothetical protein
VSLGILDKQIAAQLAAAFAADLEFTEEIRLAAWSRRSALHKLRDATSYRLNETDVRTQVLQKKAPPDGTAGRGRSERTAGCGVANLARSAAADETDDRQQDDGADQ